MAGTDQHQRDVRYADALADGLPATVSQGDSWFDYPFYLNLIDLLDRKDIWAFKRLEHSGDTMADMFGAAAMPGGWQGIDHVVGVVRAEQASSLFVSAGGNDVIAAIQGKREYLEAILGPIAGTPPQLVVAAPDNSPPSAYVNHALWLQVLGYLRAGLVRLLDNVRKRAIVYAHGYDYLVPADKPVVVMGVNGAGPWMYPVMTGLGITRPQLQRDICAILIDDFNDMLDELEEQNAPWFIHLDVRKTLGQDDWLNEIHPTKTGFGKVANALLAQWALKHETAEAALAVESEGGS